MEREMANEMKERGAMMKRDTKDSLGSGGDFELGEEGGEGSSKKGSLMGFFKVGPLVLLRRAWGEGGGLGGRTGVVDCSCDVRDSGSRSILMASQGFPEKTSSRPRAVE